MPNELVVQYRYVCHIMYDLVMLFQAPFSKAPLGDLVYYVYSIALNLTYL